MNPIILLSSWSLSPLLFWMGCSCPSRSYEYLDTWTSTTANHSGTPSSSYQFRASLLLLPSCEGWIICGLYSQTQGAFGWFFREFHEFSSLQHLEQGKLFREGNLKIQWKLFRILRRRPRLQRGIHELDWTYQARQRGSKGWCEGAIFGRQGRIFLWFTEAGRFPLQPQ